MAIAAVLMSGSESVSTPSMSKITARIVRSSATRRRVSEKNRCHNCFLAVSLQAAFRFGRDGMLPSLNVRAADTAASRFLNLYDSKDLPIRKQLLGRHGSRETERRGPAYLPLQQARRRPAHHQHQRRQYIVEAHRHRPAYRPDR